MKNIKTKAFNKKLDSKWECLFKILKKNEKVDFKLDLLKIIKQYSVFYTSLFLKDPADPLFK